MVLEVLLMVKMKKNINPRLEIPDNSTKRFSSYICYHSDWIGLGKIGFHLDILERESHIKNKYHEKVFRKAVY